MSERSSSSSEIGAGFALFLLFLGLKLGKVISWSWWWITAPLWIPVGIACLIFAVIASAELLHAVRKPRGKTWKR